MTNVSIEFNPALNTLTGPNALVRPGYAPAVDPSDPLGLMRAPSPEEVRQLNAYYGGALEACGTIRNLGSQCCCCPGGYQDAGAGRAIEDLKRQNPQGPITGADLYRLIHAATSDLDNNAASGEFNDLQSFVLTNWHRLDDQARQVWLVYFQKVLECRAQGRTGIPQDEYRRMMGQMREQLDPCQEQYQDASAGAAIQALQRENPEGVISGDQMLRLIHDATCDGDSQAAGKEFDDLSKFVQANWSRLSAEAKELWQIYADTVQEMRGRGRTGIPCDRYQEMLEEMRELQGSNDEASGNYEDAGAGDAIESINRSNPDGQISGTQMRRLILDATKDLDNNAAGAEFEDLKRFVDANHCRLSPEAREIWEIYCATVERMRCQGKTGIDREAYQQMVREMKDALD